MTTVFHPLVKRFLDGELRLADLPPELHAEARAAERLLGAVDRAPVPPGCGQRPSPCP